MRDSHSSIVSLLACVGGFRFHVDHVFSQLSQLVERLGPATIVLPAHLKVLAVLSLSIEGKWGSFPGWTGFTCFFLSWTTAYANVDFSLTIVLVRPFLPLHLWHRITMGSVQR